MISGDFMIEKQKSEILRMRTAGTTYQHIAELLGLSVNTVKSYCKRNNISKGGNSASESGGCAQCGEPLIQKEKAKRRRFCCPECRVKWWNSHPEAVNRKALYKSHCAFCGTEFTAYGNNHRKYCSHQCYINARFGGQSDD